MDIEDQIEKLSPKEGDVLVLTANNPEDYIPAIEGLELAVAVDVLFLRPGETLECLSDEDLRERNLQRIPE